MKLSELLTEKIKSLTVHGDQKLIVFDLILVSLLALGMLSTASFYLLKKQSFFDDSFIYLHIAANIIESGTARYFPISDSQMLLASSPLRLLTLTPGFFLLDSFGMPIRTIEAARFVFLTSGFVSFLIFFPFWLNNIKHYFAVSSAFFLLGASLDSLFLMEGGVLFFSFATLVKLSLDRSSSAFVVGIVVFLVGLSRPEVGLIVVVAGFTVYFENRPALTRYISGVMLALVIYFIVMDCLGVYPIPSTIWSKQVTGKLKLFDRQNLIEILPLSFAQLLGFQNKWIGLIFIITPVVFSFLLKKTSIIVVFFIGALLIIAKSMPGNFSWYSENFIILIFILWFGVAIELRAKNFIKSSYVIGSVLSVFFICLLTSNFGINKPYPWNENSPRYRAYYEVGKSVSDNGTYIIKRYSNSPVRIRMCEIGIVSYFSGKNGWIYDLCGLVQIGNLKGASTSWLRYFYPARFVENGEDQLKRFPDYNQIRVIDVWGLTQEEAVGAKDKCKYADDIFCINEYP